MRTSDQDPIAAIATAAGRGGIGVVRISGLHLRCVLEGVLGSAGAARLQPRHATYCRFRDHAGRVIDDGIAIFFPAPGSYTGEDVLELQGHGGPTVQRMLLARCLQAGGPIGLRLAAPGEFTRRAFLNERLDLAQAEAVADLIDASSEAAARSASRSLAGEFSQALEALAARLTAVRAHIEATIDFPDDDVEALGLADARERLASLAGTLEEVLRRARLGAVLRDGLQVALIGAPNVGKSSLLNALAGQPVAIVTAHPGTTRDRVERSIDIGGLVLNVIDTAGLRATDDEIERLGIERTLAAVAQADIVLELRDASGGAPAARDFLAPAWREQLAPSCRLMTVINKVDLTGQPPGLRGECLYVSARTGAGLDALRAELIRLAGWEAVDCEEGVYLARERHLRALGRAREHLAGARLQLEAGATQLELAAEELRLAGLALGEITGAVSADDLLGEIFSRFCIGK